MIPLKGENMNKNTIKFRRTLREFNGTVYIAIPKEIQEFLEMEIGEDAIIAPQTGKHGKFMAMWTEKEDDEKEK